MISLGQTCLNSEKYEESYEYLTWALDITEK